MKPLVQSALIAFLAAFLTSLYLHPQLLSPTLHLLRTTTYINHIPFLSRAMVTSPDFAGIPAIPPQDPSLNAAANTTVPRKIKMHFEAIETPEGMFPALALTDPLIASGSCSASQCLCTRKPREPPHYLNPLTFLQARAQWFDDRSAHQN
jgi:hypothetical protein